MIYLELTFLFFLLFLKRNEQKYKLNIYCTTDWRNVLSDEDIQRVTLRAGHSIYNQDYQKKRPHTEAGEVEDGRKRFRRNLVTEDNQDDYIDNRIYLAGESRLYSLLYNIITKYNIKSYN